MPKDTRESDTKDRLLAAAVKVFAAKGFMSATVREICQEAEVNVAAVNYHFGDKGQLYATVLKCIFEEYGSRRDPELAAIAADPAMPAEERLRAHIAVGVRQTYDKDCPNCEGCCKAPDPNECGPFSLFLMEMAHPSAHLEEIVQQYIEPDAKQLDSILCDFFGQDASATLLYDCASSIWGQILHPAMCWPIGMLLSDESEPQALDSERMAEHIYRVTLGGLRLIREELNNQTK